MRPTYKVTELMGDGIGAELSAAVHALAEALPIHLDFEPVDLTLENRRARGKAVYDEAVASVVANKVALKYPTITAEESPNAVLRRRLDLSVPGHEPRGAIDVDLVGPEGRLRAIVTHLGLRPSERGKQIAAQKLTASATLADRYKKNINFPLVDPDAIVGIEAGSAGLTGGGGKEPEKKEAEKKEEPKKGGFGLGKLTGSSGGEGQGSSPASWPTAFRPCSPRGSHLERRERESER